MKSEVEFIKIKNFNKFSFNNNSERFINIMQIASIFKSLNNDTAQIIFNGGASIYITLDEYEALKEVLDNAK